MKRAYFGCLADVVFVGEAKETCRRSWTNCAKSGHAVCPGSTTGAVLVPIDNSERINAIFPGEKNGTLVLPH